MQMVGCAHVYDINIAACMMSSAVAARLALSRSQAARLLSGLLQATAPRTPAARCTA
jgi:hypothetical protein